MEENAVPGRIKSKWKNPRAVAAATIVLLLVGGLGHLGLAQNSAKPKAPMEKVFPHSNKCKRCHFRAFEEWETSPLSRSIRSTAFRVALEEYLAFSGNKDKALCFRCHAPHVNEFEEKVGQFVR